jgi:hypothetical protein
MWIKAPGRFVVVFIAAKLRNRRRKSHMAIRLKQRSILPGFNLALGFTVFYL